MTEPNVAAAIAKDLGETELNSLQQIAAVVTALGEQEALALLGQTLIVEGNGGLLITNGLRRRSPGGVFFHLARQVLPREVKQRIFYGAGGLPQGAEERVNGAVAKEQSEPTRPRRRIVDISALRRPDSNDEQLVLPGVTSSSRGSEVDRLPGVTSSSRGSEVDRARQEMKAALQPLSPALQRALLVDLCATLSFRADDVIAVFASGAGKAPKTEAAPPESEEAPLNKEALPIALKRTANPAARSTVQSPAPVALKVTSDPEAEARFRGLLAVVGLARAREVLDEVEAILAG